MMMFRESIWNDKRNVERSCALKKARTRLYEGMSDTSVEVYKRCDRFRLILVKDIES